MALKRAIEPLERRAARLRQGARSDLCLPATMAEGQGDARDRIARYLGVGRTTIEKAEEVVAAAEDAPDDYGHLVEQMDRSGNVASAHRRLQVERQAREIAAAPPVLPRGPFGVIVADPPWPYEGGALPYPSLPIDAIKALPVSGLRARRKHRHRARPSGDGETAAGWRQARCARRSVPRACIHPGGPEPIQVP